MAESEDPMGEIMSIDEKIDALSKIGVIDAYVRKKIGRAVMDHEADRGRCLGDETYDEIETALRDGSPEMVRMAVIDADHVFDRQFVQLGYDNRSEDFLIACFELFTTDEYSRERKINVIRNDLKRQCCGSLGMLDDAAIRGAVENRVV